ncbi:MAG: glycyl-radical enzyme activating protein [Calditrichaceae bacterium]
MKNNGIIFDIKKYAIHDGPGIRTTVFLKGCPLDCHWCHNPESRDLQPEPGGSSRPRNASSLLFSPDNLIGREVTVDEVMREIEKDIIFYDESGGGVTFSGGEPLIQTEFLFDLLKACKKKGIHTAVDTSGHAKFELFEQIIPYTDLFLYDIKLIDDTAHIKYTGVSNELILKNARRISKNGVNMSIRIPLIPEITDTESNITEIIGFISTLEKINTIDLLPYNAIAESKYHRLGKDFRNGNRQVQSKEKIEHLRELFINHGFETYLGE